MIVRERQGGHDTMCGTSAYFHKSNLPPPPRRKHTGAIILKSGCVLCSHDNILRINLETYQKASRLSDGLFAQFGSFACVANENPKISCEIKSTIGPEKPSNTWSLKSLNGTFEATVVDEVCRLGKGSKRKFQKY